MRFACAALVLASACATSSPPAGGEVDPWHDGIRQSPLSPVDVGHEVDRHSDALSGCFEQERLNSTALSDYIFEIEIPNDGSPHRVRRLHAGVEAQVFLEQCLTDVLRLLEFPPHVGGWIKVQVPIEPGANWGRTSMR